MDKINIENLGLFNQKKPSKKEDIINEILNDKITSSYINENNITKEIIEDNIIDLIDIYEYNKSCSECNGFDKCNKSPKGYVKGFNKESKQIEYYICPCLKELYPIFSAYKYRDFTDSWLKNDLQTLASSAVSNEIKAKLLKQLSTSKGVYLYGGSGVGKSFLLASITNSFAKTGKFKMNYIKFNHLLTILKNNFEDAAEENDIIMDNIKRCDILVLDDLGMEKSSDWSKDILYSIISYRSEHKLKTYFSSRFNLNELFNLYGKYDLKNKVLIEDIKTLADEVNLVGINFKDI